MDNQFKVDVPRIVFFVGDEWIPTCNPQEVWDRLLLEFDNDEGVVENAANCFKQQFLSEHYINEVLHFSNGEVLLSHRRHRIILDEHTKLLRVEKDFIFSVVFEDEDFNLDYCMLKILYDPFKNEQVDARWNYTLNGMRSGARSAILSGLGTC
jgi:hypothetical protein